MTTSITLNENEIQTLWFACNYQIAHLRELADEKPRMASDLIEEVKTLLTIQLKLKI